jgi:cytochrome c peroxidase
MHDGSLESLDAVVAYYDRGGERVSGDERVPGNELEPLHLSAHERTALVAFLKALSP